MTDDGEAALHAYAADLAAGITAAIPGWVVRCVEDACQGTPTLVVREAARKAGADAAADIGARVTALLARDIDDQPTTPLALLRDGTRYATQVLHDAGVLPAARDAMDRVMFPEDVYGLTPGSFADVDPALAEPAMRWGAAKAWVHRRRHG